MAREIRMFATPFVGYPLVDEVVNRQRLELLYGPDIPEKLLRRCPTARFVGICDSCRGAILMTPGAEPGIPLCFFCIVLTARLRGVAIRFQRLFHSH
jgi:hypothetical protein